MPIQTPAEVRKNHNGLNFGQFLKALREAHGWSRAEVAYKLERTPQSLFCHEKNWNVPRFETLMKLAKIYKVNPQILFKKIMEMR